VREARKYPINGGLLVFDNPGASALAIYQSVVERYAACSPDDMRWWGDQISLFEVLASYRDNLLSCKPFEFNDVLVIPASTERHNWTPHDMDVSPATLWSNFFLTSSLVAEFNKRAIVHFKGPRKHLMMQYARCLYGDDLTKLMTWSGEISERELLERLNHMDQRIDLLLRGEGSVWALADEIFSLLGAVNKNAGLKSETLGAMSASLSKLRRMHSDFRFNLIFNESYSTHTV
jgi:hypothetical protein